LPARKNKAAKSSPILRHECRLVPIDDLKPHPRNARKHADEAIDKSIAANGFYKPVVASSRSGYILAGHGSWERAKAAGFTEIPVYFIEAQDEAAELRIMAADNRTNDLSPGYDDQMLAEMLQSVQSEAGGLEGAGYDQEAFDEVLKRAGDALLTPEGSVAEDEPPPIDRAEELREKWHTERGQIWQIGKHRLMCGDSTNEADVQALMQGERAGLMNTDPPYGVDYDNSERPNPGVAKPRVAKPRVANDGFKDEALQQFLESVFRISVSHALSKNAAWYLWHAHLTQGFFAAAAAAAAAQVILHRQIIWVKPVLLLGRGQYHWKHEPCFMGWVKGSQPPDYGHGDGERNQTTVWELKSVSQADRREFNHSTPKPVELFTVPIRKHLKRGETCYEPFAGSGPQFVAAEQTGVRCYGLEIEPKYCAVILERMSKLGIEPKLANPEAAKVPRAKATPAKATNAPRKQHKRTR